MYFSDPDSEEIQSGWVKVNDPFVQQMLLWTTGDDQGPDVNSPCVFVSYDQFRPVPDTEDTETVNDEADESNVDQSDTVVAMTAETSAPKRRKRESGPLSGGPLNFKFHEGGPDAVGSPVLSYVPCDNGLLKVGSITSFESSTTDFTVVKIWYDATDRLAMVTMESTINKSVKMTLPATMVQLRNSDYLRKVSRHLLNTNK